MMSNAVNYTPSQRFAIGAACPDLLLSAGAGSGKTATLTEKVCRLVTDAEHGVDVSRLLIVTFTRAAAEELRGRVRKKLEEALEAEPGSKRLQSQLVSLDGADISTISGFFLKSIRPYFSSLGLPPSFSVADEATVKVMKDKIISDVIDDFFDEGSESFLSLADALSSSRNEASMNDTVLKIADRMSAKGYPPEVLATWASGLAEDSEGDFLSSPHGKITGELTRSFAEHYIKLFEASRDELSRDGVTKYSQSITEHEAFVMRLASLASSSGYEAVKEHIASFSVSALPKSKDKTPSMERYAALKKEFKSKLTDDIAPLYTYTPDEIKSVQAESAVLIRELARVTGEFESRFSEEKRRRGVVDYTDIENFAAKIFVGENGEPTEAARELSKKYDYIFIDEYQDTNSVQDSVFSAIAAGTPRFMVGDVKQSIYAFRGAEPSVFSSYRDRFPTADVSSPADRNGRYTVFMSENFRSDSPVIKFVNLISEYMFPGTSTPFEEGDRLIFSKDQPDGYTEHRAEVALIEKPKADPDGDEKAPDDATAEAEYTAERIVSMISSETKGNGEAISPGDITILLRSAADAGKFESALSRRGVPVCDRATAEFFEQKEILLALSILNMIDNPLRDVYLAGALKSPAFGFTMEDLINVRYGKTDAPLWSSVVEYAKDGSDAALSDKCAAARAFYKEFSEKAKSADSARLILDVIDRLSLYSMTDGTSADSPRAAAIRENLQTLYEMARSYESSSFGGLYGFISYLTELMEKSVPATDEAPSDAVSIMTVHKSKGLEFPVCFVCRTSKLFNLRDTSDSILFDPELGPALKLRDPTGLVKCDNPLRVAVSKKMKYESVSEEMRVLYVALTRAKERLVVTSVVKSAEALADKYRAAPPRSVYSPFTTGSFADVILPAAIAAHKSGADFFDVVKVVPEKIGFTKIVLGAVTEEEQKDGDLTDVLRERLRFSYPNSYLSAIPAKVTVSKLSPSLLDEDAEDELEIKPKTVLPPAAPPTFGAEEGGGAERGTATHVFMQFCDFEKLRDEGFDAELERLCSEHFLTRAMADLVIKEEVEKFTGSRLFDRIMSASKTWREFRFNVSLPAYLFTKDPELSGKLKESGSDVIVQGVTDIVIEGASGELILADYKTDRLSTYELSRPDAAKEKLILRHKTQLTYYAAALEKIFGRKMDRVFIYSLALGDTAEIII